MKKFFFGSIATFLITLTVYVVAAQAAIDKIVAVVNNEVITQSELQQAITEAKQQLIVHKIKVPGEKDLSRKMLNSLIDEKLQLQFAKNVGFTVGDSDVDSAIADIAKNNKLSVAQLKTELETHGINYSKYRRRLKQEILIRKLQQQVLGPKINVTDQEVQAFMRQAQKNQAKAAADIPDNREFQVLDMLIPLPQNATAADLEQAKDEAVNLLHKMGDGKDFMQFGKEAQITDLGFRTISDIPDSFVKAIKKMRVDDVAGPIIAPNGLHIIKLVAIRGKKITPTKITFMQAKEYVYQQKFAERLANWLKELRARAYIKLSST